MTRTIMVIPLGNSFGLTSVILSLVKLFYPKKKIIFFKPFPDSSHNIYNTTYILKKYFSISSIQPILHEKEKFLSKKIYIKKIIKDNLELYYSYKKKYDIILIEGKKNNNNNYYIHNLNIIFSNKINVELLFYNSNNNISHFIQQIEFYKKNNIFNNILGIINNFCNSNCKLYNNIIFKKEYFDKYIFYKNKINLINIPWNKKLIFFPIHEIFKSIKIINKIKQEYNIHLIKSFILYKKQLLNNFIYINNFSILFSSNIFIQKYDKFVKFILNNNIFHSIIFTNCNKYNICILKKIKKKYNIHIPFFYTILIFRKVMNIIKNFNINSLKNDQILIKYITNYISKYINKIIFLDNSFKNKIIHTHYSSILFKKNLIEKARNINCNILLPEGNEERIIHAANIISNLNIAHCTLLGNSNIIYNIAKNNKINISKNITIINPTDIYQDYIEKLFLLRSHKGMNLKSAKHLVQDNMILGSLLLRYGQVDGMVCGIKYTTADVLRTAIQIIGIKDTEKKYFNSLVSSSFFMLLKDRVLIYSDCAVNINPNIHQLANIAIETANLSMLFNIKPKIAMLSYSTGCSGSGDTVEKVKHATNLVKKIKPNFIIDGPIQYDAASNIVISNIKAPLSPLKGNANIFIFPDLNSGNITYKAVQQSANAYSIGPILQGLNRPVNDLSRGATIDDIVYTILVTIIQSNIS